MNDSTTISKEGAVRMLLHNQWIAREAPKRGLRDPWAHRPDEPTYEKETIYPDPNNKKHGIQVTRSIYPEVDKEVMEAWRQERDYYMAERDKWIALQMFKRFGYETFLEDCHMYGLSEVFQKSVLPCESKGNPQCSMFCSNWDNCERR